MAKQYNPRTGEWEDIYLPPPNTPGQTDPKTENDIPKPTPPQPTTPDKGDAHQGSGEDNKDDAEHRVREIEYDLEGTAVVHPSPEFSMRLTARDMVAFEGLGNNFSGTYFLATVVHTINRSGYSMSLDVLRNNFVWVSSDVVQPVVTPKQEPQSNARSYTVKKGDTLWAISRRFYGSGTLYMRIVNANRGKIKDPHWIYPNQVFVIP